LATSAVSPKAPVGIWTPLGRAKPDQKTMLHPSAAAWGFGVGDAVDLQPVPVEQGDQPATVAELDGRRDKNPNGVSGRQGPGVEDQPPLLTVQDRPAGQINVLVAGVQQGDGLCLWCRAGRVDQRGDDAHGVIGFPRFNAGKGVPGLVVGVPGLGLEGQEDRDPLVLGRVVHQQTAVLPNPVVSTELLAVALVHVDVMDPVAGRETKDLVRGGRLGSPSLPERVQPGSWVGYGPLHEVVQLVGQVVVGPRGRGRHRSQHRWLEQVGPDEVQRQPTGRTRERGESLRQVGQPPQQGMIERLVCQVQQLRGVLLGQHVDRNPELHASAPHVDLVVRRVDVTLGPPINGSPDQHPIPC
jgi:hypothetical protein